MSRATKKSLFSVLGWAQAANLGAVDKLVLVYLRWRQGHNGISWPSLRTIEGDLHIDRGNCLRAIRRLCASGCIRKVSAGKIGRGYANHYEVLPDKGMHTDTLSPEIKGCVAQPSESEKGCVAPPERDVQYHPKEERSTKKSSAPCTSSARTSARKGTAKSAKQSFTPPTVDDVRAYAESRGDPDFEADTFVDYYTCTGWKRKNDMPVLDWKATVREWMKRNNARRIERGEPPRDGYSQYGTREASPEEAEAALRDS